MSDKRKRIRTPFRKHHQSQTRRGDLTRDFQQDRIDEEAPTSERVSGKGELTRHRTVIGEPQAGDVSGLPVDLEVGDAEGMLGRVLCVHGLASSVQGDDGRLYNCVTRGLLKMLSTTQRQTVAVGDRVWFRRVGEDEGAIQRVEPRTNAVSRASRGRQHVIVANLDQALIVTSTCDPPLKANLVDRFLVTAELSRVRPIICINKIDRVDPADLQPLVGVYGQMGYTVLLVSAATGFGVDRLARMMKDKESALLGQSGVGKSSLLNAIEPDLKLRVGEVSRETRKGSHTTTAAQLIPLAQGGFVVDTPGMRQFQLWDIVPEEIAGCFRDLRPYVHLCRYPDCTHTHEADCAVKDAVADGRLDARRYESYCKMLSGDAD